MLIVAQFTVIVAVAELSVSEFAASLDAATVAVFERVPQSWASVTPKTCTEALAPSARVKPWPPHVRTPALIPHVHPPLTWLKLQLTAEGSVSVSDTSFATPGPSLVAVIVNPAVSPALIVFASATFVTEMLGWTTAMALGWMLRSWFLFELLSSCWVRMCHGAPLIVAAPFAAPPLDSFQ